MGEAIGGILAVAIGVAISPIPIIAVILMLFTPRARSNSVAFMLGWIVGLAVVGAIVLSVGLDGSSDGGEGTSAGWLKVALGAILLVLAVRRWRHRPRGDAEPEMPKWMATIDKIGVPQAFGLAVLLSAINPKNLALTIAGAATIATAGLSVGGEIVVLVVYIAIASVTIVLPVAVYVVMGSSAEAALTSMKDWLTANSDTVLAVLLLVIGVKILGDGIVALN